MAEIARKEPKVDSTLSKGLAILENLSQTQGGKGVTELSRELGLTKSNTFRLLQTLTTLGYVKHGDDKSYAATLKAWRMGRSAVENLNLRPLAAAEMQYLSEETGEAIYLAVPENLTVIYIDKRDGQKPIRSWNPIGGAAPMHCVGTGKAILAANYETLRERIKGHLTPHTALTITSMKALDTDIAETRKRGFAIDRGEFRERILSFGAPVTLPNGIAVAALGISLPDISLPEGGAERMGSLVMHAARGVSGRLSQL